MIEVVYSSGGLSKLEVWRGLGAREVWFWTRDRQLLIFARGPRGWRAAPRSALVPGLDPPLLARCMSVRGQPAAVATLPTLVADAGMVADHTEDAQAFTADNLARYRVVIFASTTGDVLGAFQQISEILFYLVFLISIHFVE